MPDNTNDNVIELDGFATSNSSDFLLNFANGMAPLLEQDGPESRNGYNVTVNTPVISRDRGLAEWVVSWPRGENVECFIDENFWSPTHSLPFKIVELIEPATGTWKVVFDPNWGLMEAEYDDYTCECPFEYNGRLYVVMNHEEYDEMFVTGNVYYDSYEGREYRLRQRTRSDLFGSENAFRCEWVSNYPSDDYSVERDEIDVRNDIAPVILTNVGREVPLVSFEQEFSGNGETVARMLNEMGYCFSPYVEAYHNAEGRFNQNLDSSAFCYVETDSSCGYELIFSKINLRDRTRAEQISEVQKVLQELKNEGTIRLSAACGFHVHVDVSTWAMKDVVSAYHLWNYMEDTIFRFASAFWNSHRDEETGHEYSLPVRKGHTTRTQIGRSLSQRRDALNFAPFLSARGRCNCDALIYEDWENCTCNLSQPTIEFRVFNATTNQRKIRAYLAFCVAFVNMAKKHQHSPEFFPEMRFVGTNVRETQPGKTWEEAQIERINYIMNNFPLTSVEKSDIMYCFRNCSLESVLERL